jgi:HEAT repeat protein
MSKQEKLTDTLLHGTRTERREAAEDLGEYNNIASVAVLVDALFNDGSSKVRAQAAQSLGEIADPRAYDALVRSSDSDEDEDVSTEAEEAAEKIQDKVGDDKLYVSQPRPLINEDVEKLVIYLEDLRYGRAEIRERAAEKLSKFRNTQAVAALINTMVNDANKEVREEAAESLGKIGDRMALPFLKSARYNDSSESVRKDAEKSIDRIYDTIQ